MPITKGFQQLVDEAMAQVTTYSVEQVRARLADGRMQIVDIRDVRELEREGTVPGALLAPRGMLEFWVDPASPYHKPVFADESKEFVLFCGAGWRSVPDPIAAPNVCLGDIDGNGSVGPQDLAMLLNAWGPCPQ